MHSCHPTGVFAAAIISAFTLACVSVHSFAAPTTTELRKAESGWQLLRGGKPYPIHGAGGSGSKQLLKSMGGNSFRTWDAEDIDKELDEAQKLGLTVTVGIWLKHERHGFSYNDADFAAEQLARVQKFVTQYKDHPAVLMWALGNEMEGEMGENAAIWSHVESCAALTKRIDPSRPTMTVIAELGGDKVKNINRLCPSIDIVGINTYAGAASVIKRYRALGGTKPVVITEFGPAGTWEVERNAFKALPEPTADEKAEAYRRHYVATVRDGQDLVLGSYAFTWGNKLEMTATWFGMLLPDGSKLPAVDVMCELWTGKPPANRCPQIEPIKLSGSQRVSPGTTIEATVAATDPENDPLKYEWVLWGEVAKPGIGGDAEAHPPTFADAVTVTQAGRATIRMPAELGNYRLYVYVRDGKGSATTANIPLLIEAVAANESTPSTPPTPPTTPPTPSANAPAGVASASLPFIVYSDADGPTPFAPTGWMGNHAAIKLDAASKDNPHRGKTCLKLQYTAADAFGGIAWQHPAEDWGEKPGGYDLTGAKKLRFWSRGAAGGEKVEFKFGILGAEKQFADSGSGDLTVELLAEWKQYEIDLSGKDLGRIKTGFCWVTPGQGKAITFFVDDIAFVRE